MIVTFLHCHVLFPGVIVKAPAAALADVVVSFTKSGFKIVVPPNNDATDIFGEGVIFYSVTRDCIIDAESAEFDGDTLKETLLVIEYPMEVTPLLNPPDRHWAVEFMSACGWDCFATGDLKEIHDIVLEMRDVELKKDHASARYILDPGVSEELRSHYAAIVSAGLLCAWDVETEARSWEEGGGWDVTGFSFLGLLKLDVA